MKKYILLCLGLLLILVACNTDSENAPSRNDDPGGPVENQTSTSPIEGGLSRQEDDLEENGDIDEEDRLDEEDEPDEDVDNEDQTDYTSNEEYLGDLIEESDYIIHLNMTQTGSSGREFTIINEYKGSFQNIEIPNIENIEPNKDYLVFMKDDTDGSIVLTDGPQSLIDFDESDDILEKLDEDLNLSEEDLEEDTRN